MDEFYRDMVGWLKSGAVTSRETVVEGLERMPGAFLGLFSGANMGKMLVKL
jgi:NADPH-dependent curcumin reductase CurA